MLEALQADLFSQARGFRGRGDRDLQSRQQVTNKLIASVLDQAQFARLRQLEVQFEGIRALENERVAQALDLSDEQKKDASEYGTANRNPSFEELEKMVVEILNDDQLEKWNREIHGPQFEFSDEMQRFREFIARLGDRRFGGRGRGAGRRPNRESGNNDQSPDPQGDEGRQQSPARPE